MSWNWLRRFWGGTATTPRRVFMYTRQGCHLCDDGWALLEQARARHGFALEKIDVDTDPALAARYGTEVPVVTIDGKERFRGQVNAVLLARVFREP
jgi:glutaredoxin